MCKHHDTMIPCIT